MKKYFYYAISALLMASSVITTSCSNEDDSLNEIQSDKPTITHWVEPYHVKDGTVEDAKAYMSDAMNRYALSGETSNSSSIQLRYTTGEMTKVCFIVLPSIQVRFILLLIRNWW